MLETTYRSLIDHIHEGVITLNVEGTVLFCNTRFSKMVNQPVQKITGCSFDNFIEPSSKDIFSKLFSEGSLKYVQQELYIYHGNGNGIPVLMSVNRLTHEKVPVFSIVVTDLTKQKRTEEELRLRASELAQKNTELLEANRALLIQNEEKEKRAEELSAANLELYFQNVEKEKRAAELAAANIELAYQNAEKETRAAELIVANKELEFENQEKEKRAIELSTANKDLSSFSYVSSHDLQDPLLKIQNFITCILEEEKNLSDTGKQYFTRITKTTQRMQAFIVNLLSYSRTKSIDQAFVMCDLNKIIEDVVSNLDQVIAEKNARIEVQSFAEARIIPFQFTQLFHNLISNSLKFHEPGEPPVITISNEIGLGAAFSSTKLTPEKTYCHITIADNGIGFDFQYKERIFEVFQRLHTYEEYNGTGIGLAICKRIIEIHGGDINASSGGNGGARFDLFLPINN